MFYFFYKNFEEIYTINLYCLINTANLQISTVNLGLLKGIFSLLLLSAHQKKRFGSYNSISKNIMKIVNLHSDGELNGINQNSNALEKIWKNKLFSNNYLCLQYFEKTKLNNKQLYNVNIKNLVV